MMQLRASVTIIPESLHQATHCDAGGDKIQDRMYIFGLSIFSFNLLARPEDLLFLFFLYLF